MPLSIHKEDGVTMIELLVSLGIFVILAMIVMFGFVGSRKFNELRLAADTFANNVRRVQSAAIAGQMVNGSVPGGFGISVDLSGTNNRFYRLFADTLKFQTGTCSAGQNQRNDVMLGAVCINEAQFSDSPVQLSGDVLINKVYIGPILVDANTERRADVVFKTPDAVVHAHYGNSTSSYDPTNGQYLPSPATNQIIIVCLYHPQLKQFRKITILGATGQVDVSNNTATCAP